MKITHFPIELFDAYWRAREEGVQKSHSDAMVYAFHRMQPEFQVFYKTKTPSLEEMDLLFKGFDTIYTEWRKQSWHLQADKVITP